MWLYGWFCTRRNVFKLWAYDSIKPRRSVAFLSLLLQMNLIFPKKILCNSMTHSTLERFLQLLIVPVSPPPFRCCFHHLYPLDYRSDLFVAPRKPLKHFVDPRCYIRP